MADGSSRAGLKLIEAALEAKPSPRRVPLSILHLFLHPATACTVFAEPGLKFGLRSLLAVVPLDLQSPIVVRLANSPKSVVCTPVFPVCAFFSCAHWSIRRYSVVSLRRLPPRTGAEATRRLCSGAGLLHSPCSISPGLSATSSDERVR